MPRRRSRARRILTALAVVIALVAGMSLIASRVGWTCLGPGWTGDIETNAPGEPTPEAAIETWRTSESPGSLISPPAGPWRITEGEEGSLVGQYGNWRVGLLETDTGGWVVSGLQCSL